MSWPEPSSTDMSSPLPPSNALAVDLAGEVHHDQVAVRRGVLLRRVVPSACLAGELLELLVDRAFVGLDRQALELQAVDRRRRNVGQRLEADRTSASLPGS